MGILDRLFGKKKRDSAAERREARERFDQAIDEMVGISGKAELSERGHPVCPKCGREFPVSANRMQDESDGSRVGFICPNCRAQIRL